MNANSEGEAAGRLVTPLNADMDAQRWTREFLKAYEALPEDEGLSVDFVRAWFANAIMCGHDVATGRNSDRLAAAEQRVTALEAETQDVQEAMKTVSERNSQLTEENARLQEERDAAIRTRSKQSDLRLW